MKKIVASGRSVDEAVTSALVRMGVARSQAKVRVLSEPVKGLFGFIGAKGAMVEISIPQTAVEDAKDFAVEVLAKMKIQGDVSIERDEENADGYVLSIGCEQDVLPVVIGRHGATLDALQYLLNVVANRDHDEFVKFSVDAGRYRARRRENLRRVADGAADRAIRTGRAVSLEAMSAAERKWVHTYLESRMDITTISEGQDPNRKVRIAPKGSLYMNG